MVAHLKMATFNVVICHKQPENRPRIKEEEIYLCLEVYKRRKENTDVNRVQSCICHLLDLVAQY